MSAAVLLAHPDLVTRLAYPEGQCAATVRLRGGTAWRCERRATWQVTGHWPECGQHALRTLREELQARTDAAGGS